jgi:Protein of unknown function (DUF1573)
MKSRFAAIVAIVLSASCFAADSPVTVEKPHRDCGVIVARKPLEQTFVVRNTSAEAVELTGVAAACGCVKRHLAKTHLKPGESTELLVVVNLITQPEGAMRWNFAVKGQSASGVRFEVPLSVAATIRKEIAIEPVSMVLATSTEVSGRLTLTDLRPGKSLRVRTARVPLPGVTATLSNAKEGPQTVEIALTRDFPYGSQSDEIVLETDDPDYREIRIPLRAIRNKPDEGISASPADIRLRFAGTQATATALIRLRDAAESKTAVESVEADVDGVTAKWADGPGMQTTLRVSVDRNRVGGYRQAIVTVRLKSPRAETVIIPVSWTVPDPIK